MKKISSFLALLLSVFYFGQTSLVNYQFENNLTPDAGAIGSPVISLVNTSNFNNTYSAGPTGSGIALTTNNISTGNHGGYLKLTINTTGYNNINLSFAGYGSGTNTKWEVYANKTGATPSLIPTNNDSAGSLSNANGSWNNSFSTILSTATNVNYNDTALVTIYIAAFNGSGGNRTVRIDNLKITGCKIPNAPTASSQTFCSAATVANLTASGEAGSTFSWYTTSTGGVALAPGTALSTGNYYVSQTNTCGTGNESLRTLVGVTVNLPASAVTANSITVNSAQITWTGAGNYLVEYGPVGYAPGVGASAGSGGTLASINATSPFTLNGLLSGTSYDVYVRRINCPVVGQFGSNSPKGTFSTLFAPCTTPLNPSVIKFSAVSSTDLTIGFTPPGTAPSGGYVVFRSTSATAPVLTNGTVYSNGSTYSLPGNSYLVVSNGTAVSIPQTGLTSNTRYYYYVFSQNTACSGQPFYSTGINGSQVTCAAAPAGNTVSNITPSGVNISWTAAPTGGGATAINYFVDVSANAGFTAPVAGSPFSAGTSVTSSVTGLSAGTTYYYRVRANNGCESQISGSFSTTCKPTASNPSINYINDVEFRGTLNDVQNNNSGVSDGYQDFTSMANKTVQAAGEGINIFVKSSGRDTSWKAWIDWNRDGVFNNTVYNATTNPTGEIMFSAGVQAISTSFGIIIPAGTAPGDYVVRIRNFRSCTSATGPCGSTTYDPCAAFTGTNNGEAEDYIINVIANCASGIVALTPVETCGSASFAIVAKGNAGTTRIRWYDAETGGSMVAETLVDASFQSTFVTPMLSETTTYWVTSFNGTCETLYRKPVTATIKPIPQFTFSLPPGNANFCGDEDRLVLSTAGSMEEVTLINEDFEGGALGVFTVTTGTGDNSTVTDTRWQNKASIFTPVGSIWKPAISSGYGGNKFAYSTSDYSTRTIHSILTSTAAFNTTGFTDLKLEFSAYYSYYGDTSPSAGGTVEGLYVEVSTNGGTTWVPANVSYNQNQSLGYGTAFQDVTISLDAFVNVNSLKLRFRYNAYWGDGVAIDNIKLYGHRPLTTSFVWTAPNIGVYQANCTTPYVNGTPTASVCIKPNDVQMQTISDWNISAQQTVSNGCTTSASIAIHNQNKVWDTTASTNWGVTNWQPTTAVPAIDKCVLIKKPVNILTGGNFEAKNVKVVTGGTLTINKDASLKIQDYIRNESAAGAGAVVVESDASLVQVNEGNTINTGTITAKRDLKLSPGRQQYNYIMSPLEGQNLKNIYSGIDYVLYHNEANNFFYNSSGAYIKGRALAVKEPNKTGVPGTPATVTATFTGYPTNGAFTYGIVNSNTANMAKRGFNLVGNPYPSNMDLIEFYKLNGGAAGNIGATFHLWDNRANSQTVQMGDKYGQQAYAIFNAVDNTGTLATGDAGLPGINRPTQYVKMGQGFMTQSKVASQQLKFDNTIRTTNKGTVSFFGKGAQETQAPVDRYWLNMVTPANLAAQIAVVYFEGGNNAFTDDDSSSMGGSDALYSIVDGEKVAINGRSSFTDSDVVPLGTAHFTGGNYTLTIQDKEGIFATGQSIYLKDKQTGILTDLSQGNYTFTANAGESAGRFEIVYKPEMVLATDGAVKEEIQVYRDGNSFVVKSLSKKISSLEVYDASGKLISTLQPNSIKAVIDAASLANGMYLIKIHQNGEVTSRKILK